MAGTGKQLRVVNFHGIGDPARKLEPGEARYWIGIDRFRQVLDRIAGHPDREFLWITFDDGNISDRTIAFPELKRRGLDAAFFVLTGRIGQVGSLDAEDIRALSVSGMRVGSHGMAHRDWASLPPGELEEELRISKAVLEGLCASPIRAAAIPFGRYNAAVLAGLHDAGYEEAYSSDGGSMESSAFLRPRTSIRQDMTDADLEQILSGQTSVWRKMRRTVSIAIKRRV